MPKNPVLRLVIGLVVCAWLVYDLFGPGEAQRQAVVILESVLLLCGIAGIIGSLVQIAARK
jgi:hypothetical protein